jgi:hypothetical protein
VSTHLHGIRYWCINKTKKDYNDEKNIVVSNETRQATKGAFTLGVREF